MLSVKNYQSSTSTFKSSSRSKEKIERGREKERAENSLRGLQALRSFHLEISELDNSCDRHSRKERHATRVHDGALKVRMKTF